jgi:hypothetical protein
VIERTEVLPSYVGKKVCVSGEILDIFNPNPINIDLIDIGWGLANQIRFGGQCLFPYSVGQHSVLLSRMVPEHLAAVALMHDAAEAYVGDIITPLKKLMPEFEVAEHKILRVVFEKFSTFYHPLDFGLMEEFKTYDLQICWHEANTLQPYQTWTKDREVCPEIKSHRILQWTPEETRRAFFERADELIPQKMSWMQRYVRFCDSVGVQA